MNMVVKVKRLDPKAKLPNYAYRGDAAFDLCAREEAVLEPGVFKGVSTGLSLEIPEGYVGLIWDKSGLSIKEGIKTLGGVVDCGYRGEIVVGLVNLGSQPKRFAPGDKLAQMIIQKKEEVVLEEAELSETERGEKGFGSSGK